MCFMQPLLGTFWFAVVYPTSGRKERSTQIKVKGKTERGGKKRRDKNNFFTHLRMFTEHPDTKSYFAHFKGMDSAEEMKQSDQVRGHGKKVFTAINDMVQHLDNSEAFLGIVNPLGKKHATQLKIDPKNFRIICDIILQLMEEKFGGDCKASFEKVTNEICTHLNNVYKEAGW
ncbi:cytoglobin-1-like isoform X1 [Rissa tridactyla]|uniref:cytoglobin-1-like isoform X1 n=1 Tax=Rissa tridactyla TaxID=75485 RepID=UPI0023BACAE4|nr:cytoglobin-1-like isoform X1 [Rissa tridactyla]